MPTAIMPQHGRNGKIIRRICAERYYQKLELLLLLG
jgi:hypothetical protein